MSAVLRARLARVVIVMTLLGSGAVAGTAARAVAGDDPSTTDMATTSTTTLPAPDTTTTVPATDTATTVPATDPTSTTTTTVTDPTTTDHDDNAAGDRPDHDDDHDDEHDDDDHDDDHAAEIVGGVRHRPDRRHRLQQREDATLLRVRAQMAKYNLAFVTHDGDTKPQSMPCTDTRDKAVYNVFNGFARPSSTRRATTSGRTARTPHPDRLPPEDLLLDRQLPRGQEDPAHRQKTYVENARWTKGGVVFATLDVPGPNGKSSERRGDVRPPRRQRRLAQRRLRPGPGDEGAGGDGHLAGRPVQRLVRRFTDGRAQEPDDQVRQAGRPRPRRLAHVHPRPPWPTVPNFTRLETFGDSGINKWVKATVDPDSPGVFTFTTITS